MQLQLRGSRPRSARASVGHAPWHQRGVRVGVLRCNFLRCNFLRFKMLQKCDGLTACLRFATLADLQLARAGAIPSAVAARMKPLGAQKS